MAIERRRRRRDLIPRDPFDIIRRFRNEIEDMFHDFMRGSGPGFSEIMEFRTPPIDIQETENEIIVKADIPGLEKENIDLEIAGDRLRIKAESEKIKEEDEKGYHRRERSMKSVYREILLPKNIKQEESKASYKNGVLKVILTKIEDEKGKKLEIE
ncbi:MAG: Hsp20/alpha crystallin family protein [Candidatus Hodarchaeales archaeon]|jgi:HSP20 family protein